MSMRTQRISEGILYTDFYQLTMAQLYFHSKIHIKRAQFEYFFRHYPDYGSHKAGFCVNAGLYPFIKWMKSARFDEEAIGLLRAHKGLCGKRLFGDAFLKWLGREDFLSSVSVRAVAEGRIVHAGTPIAVVEGPLAEVQILESSLLNHLNYQTLIATKAARVKEACYRQPVLEFGLRRAQSRGANAGARAALIGGADFTSNTGVSYALGYPPKGTHAHSMVQAFIALGQSEIDAFRAYAELYPDNCILLVDTIDTLESGIPNAIKVFRELRKRGHEPAGIRLDSGDLAYLAVVAAKMLDEAGFPDAKIVLSNKLNEIVIWQIISQIKKEASKYGVDTDSLITRLLYGVGTALITSEGSSALDGVYKITALKDGGKWQPAFKISESAEKTINPCRKRLWRIYDRRKKAVADLLALYEEEVSGEEDILLRHPTRSAMKRVLKAGEIGYIEPMLEDIVRDGRSVYDFPSIDEIRRVRNRDLNALDDGVKRIIEPHRYHVSLSQRLWEVKQGLLNSFGKRDMD